ncbi:MAG TPA: M23 family metallopeptidase [Patescibacteria group bacterium]|nr:M23 family metallopeptidase [Patescibacteria group bacterium]
MKVRNLVFAGLSIFLIAAGCSKVSDTNTAQTSSTSTNTPANTNTVTNTAPSKEVVAPISRASERVTKKPFGIYITPKTSPVQPEKFTGFHSGVDFETFPEEKDIDVAVSAACSGKIAAVRTATGYGGVITEYCTIDNQKVTVVYGHIRLSSAKVKAGQEVKAGDQIAVLGTGYSKETDGERKHLHLGIIKGQGTDIRGYVQQQSQLTDFLDITKLF